MRIVVFTLFLTGFVALPARANLQVYPTRLSLSDTIRAGMISIRNRGDKPETFKVSVSYFRMKTDGSLEAVSEAKEIERPLLGEHLRFSPREFTLPPNAEQVVRVLYAGGGGEVAEGEYRCHLNVAPIPTETKQEKTASKTMKIVLEAKLAVAVPIFFRHGNVTSDVELENLRLLNTSEAGAAAALDMKFNGNGYPFGEFIAFLSKGSDEGDEIGRIRGVAAYISPRKVTIPLTVLKEKLSGKTLRVEYRLPETEKALKSLEAKIP